LGFLVVLLYCYGDAGANEKSCTRQFEYPEIEAQHCQEFAAELSNDTPTHTEKIVDEIQ